MSSVDMLFQHLSTKDSWTFLMTLQATNIVSMYRELARVPQPVDAFASYTPDGRTLHLTTVWESLDTEMGQKVRFTRHHTSAFDNQGPLSFHQVGHAQEVPAKYVICSSHC